jgi:hypothetical protein
MLSTVCSVCMAPSTGLSSGTKCRQSGSTPNSSCCDSTPQTRISLLSHNNKKCHLFLQIIPNQIRQHDRQEAHIFSSTLYTAEPQFTNNSDHEQIFPAKKSRMTNGVSDYERASWQQQQAGDRGKLRVSARECQLLVN